MGKKQARNTAFRLEDYNEPTQPVAQIILPPVTPGYSVGEFYPEAPTSPGTWQGMQPFPVDGFTFHPFAQYPSSPVYPVLPSAPRKSVRGYPPGGSRATYADTYKKKRRSLIPGLVRLLFALIQLTLLACVVLLLLGIQATTLWLGLLLGAGDLFVLPVRWLAANVNTSILTGTELLTCLELLLAALFYNLVSRLLVSCLRALLT